MQLYNYLGVLQSGLTEQTLYQLPQISCGTTFTYNKYNANV